MCKWAIPPEGDSKVMECPNCKRRCRKTPKNSIARGHKQAAWAAGQLRMIGRKVAANTVAGEREAAA